MAIEPQTLPPTTGEPTRHRDPDLDLLLGDGAGEILGAVAASAGAQLRTWTPDTVTHHPDRSTLVRYRADLEWSDGAATTETLVVATGDRIPEGAAVLENGDRRVAVWRWPNDPALPGLERALDRARMAALLDDLGVGGDIVRLRVRAYRPGRRAVVEATGRHGRLFLKIVRPHRVEALHVTHRRLAEHVPVPDSLGWTEDGIVVMAALPGRTLREVVRSGGDTVPPAAALHDLLDGLARADGDWPDALDLVSCAGDHAAVVGAAMPDAVPMLDGLVRDLATLPLADHPEVVVHGDFYETQVMVHRGRVSGLLDIDTVGRGHRIDDIARLCAHLVVLEQIDAGNRRLRRYRRTIVDDAYTRFDRTDLHARVAAGVIGLATGPFRVQDDQWRLSTLRRLELARSWIDSA